MQENSFKNALLNPSRFRSPGNWCREEAQEDTAWLMPDKLPKGEKISALTLTDNPGGTPAMSADFMGGEMVNLGMDAVHFTCKDKNRNQIESQLYALQ